MDIFASYYQLSLQLSFLSIFFLLIIPHTLMFYYLIKDIGMDDLDRYLTLALLTGFISSIASCYLMYTKGV